MKKLYKIVFGCWAVLFAVSAVSGAEDADTRDAEAQDGGVDIYYGYYSREQNDGELAQASRKSHYIKFYPEHRIVRLFIPYPYSRTVTPETIRKVFDMAISRSVGSAYIADTFGLLDERAVVHLDSVRYIEGKYYFDCGVSVPCKIEFSDELMTIIQKGLVKDHITAYDRVVD